MPGMSLHRAGCRMVPRYRQNIGAFPQEDRQGGIECLDRFFLRLEIAILAMHISVLEVCEEKIIAVIFIEITLKLLRDSLRPFELRHPNKLSQPFIHWIDSNTSGFE